jgi:hypothetical protein
MVVNLSAVHSNQSKLIFQDRLKSPPNDLPRVHHRRIGSNWQETSSGLVQQTNVSIHQLHYRKDYSAQSSENEDPEVNTKPLPSSLLWSIETSYLYTSPKYGRIRSWGCQLSTTPLIYVHIGKTGGGTVRARLAASSLNYTKTDYRKLDFSYYPLKRQKPSSQMRSTFDDEHRAQFCDSGYNLFNLQPTVMPFRSFQCNASTPLGLAIACPEIYHNIYDPDRVQHLKQNNVPVALNNASDSSQTVARRHPCFYPPSSDHAHLVFASHHNFGAEMHWLPARMLSIWWSELWATTKSDDRIAEWLESLQTPFNISKFFGHHASETDDHKLARPWCKGKPRPIYGYAGTSTFHQACSREMYQPIDELANVAVKKRMARIKINSTAGQRWSTLYASLPVLRVTILRDPFSWLCSKFFWHNIDEQFNVTCDDVDVATHGDWSTLRKIDRPHGWARRMALQYLHQLCGDDCVVRSYQGNASNLQEIELQASANLRQGFAVVGIMSDLDEFYDMLNRRVDYLNTALNKHVVGERHESSSQFPEEATRCKHLYRHNRPFQKLILQGSPEMAALQRLYKIGCEVNKFQRTELAQCYRT